MIDGRLGPELICMFTLILIIRGQECCTGVCVCVCVHTRGGGCHCCLLVSCSVVPTERGRELSPLRGVQHRPVDGEHRSDTGETTKLVFYVLVFVFLQSESLARYVSECEPTRFRSSIFVPHNL